MVNENLNGMVKDVYYGKTLRKSYARHEEILEMPNLLEVQKNSYQWFLDKGLREVFKDVATWSTRTSRSVRPVVSATWVGVPPFAAPS